MCGRICVEYKLWYRTDHVENKVAYYRSTLQRLHETSEQKKRVTQHTRVSNAFSPYNKPNILYYSS